MTSTSSTTPLVSVRDVNAHIALMRSIHKLQEDFQLGGIAPKTPYTPDALKFLRRAVTRFGIWLNTRNDQADLSALDQIPPLDVLMVWHAYMLLPVTYWIDSQQLVPTLASLGGMPWGNLLECIKADSHEFTATSGQRQSWVDKTSLPYVLDTTEETVDTLPGAPRFSVDLVRVIVTQSRRISAMLEAVDDYNKDGAWIDDAVAEYPAFMQLTSDEPVSPSIPVDIVWHTHQLAGTVYNDDCKQRWGHIQGHNSGGEGGNSGGEGGNSGGGGGSGQVGGDNSGNPPRPGSPTPSVTPSVNSGCSKEVYVLFGPRKWTDEPSLLVQFHHLLDAMPIGDLEKSEFYDPSSIRYLNSSGIPHSNPSGIHGPRDKIFILIGYLIYPTAKAFVNAWKKHPAPGEEGVVAILLGSE